ncbi:dihydroxyacetone kinase subunit DhaL [Brachyspira pilosicoli]|uniref:dihydroxyacetone kinase subunit DhaL n=1 Tax=Brachyspira pilosicoli TaxID=52584 RepID=UPI00300489E5
MNKFIELSKNLDTVFSENAEYLCKLDCEAGDGDHGLTISRGFRTAYEEIKKLDSNVADKEVVKSIGYAMLGSMGGASGPIFSTLFIQMAITLNNEQLNVKTFKDSVLNTIHAINEMANTNRGEKTMVDALYGAVDELEKYNGNDLVEAMNIAQQGALNGANATINMKATKGRAKFLQERSIGFMDAGSYSIYLIFKTIYETWKNN